VTAAPVVNETIRSITRHRSIRAYRDEPVAEEMVDAILAAAQAAPTSSHKQAYSVIRVRDPEVRRRLAVVGDDQEWIEEAPVFFMWCADLHRIKVVLDRVESPMAYDNVEEFVVACVDTTLAASYAFVAAESLGLGGVLIGGMRNDPDTVTRLLELPQLVFPMYGLCLGWPAEDPWLKPRLPRSVVVHEERYQPDATILAGIEAYDAEVSRYYVEREGGNRTTTWTSEMARKFAEAQRPHLRAYLDAQGFRFD
jgi:FMN reductase (NADPH)